MAGSSTAPAPTLPSTSTAARKTTKSPTERTCDLDCIEINHPLHTFAEPVNDDDDDFDPISLGWAMRKIVQARLNYAVDRRMSVPDIITNVPPESLRSRSRPPSRQNTDPQIQFDDFRNDLRDCTSIQVTYNFIR